MEFYWDLTEENFNSLQKNFVQNFIGCVRVGDICFDIVERSPSDWEKDGCFLTADLYVGGVDNGYGYSSIDDWYPYDERDGYCFDEKVYSMTYEEFKEYAEKTLSEFIDYCNDEEVKAKAKMPLHIW